MNQRITSCVPAIIGLFAAILAFHPTRLFAASDCIMLTHPAYQARHWHYHVDRSRKCWHAAAEHAAIPPQVEPPQPDTARPPFSSVSSFVSSIASVFTAAITPQPDTLNPDVIAQPESPLRGDYGAPKWRRHAETRHQRRYAEAKFQRRHAEVKAPSEPKSKPSHSHDQADRDALFREYLHWQEQQ